MFLKGLIYLIISQAVFVLCGFATNFWLARYFGPELYGTYSVVISLLTWIQLFVMSGVPFALQKFIAEQPEKAYAIKRVAIRVQLIYSSVIFLIFFILVQFIAHLFGNPQLVFYLRIVSFSIVLIGLYRFYLGFQNGLRKFRIQAIIVISYAVSKLLAIFGLVLLGLSLTGALIGTVVGSFVGYLVGIHFSKTKRIKSKFNVKKLINFALPNIIYIVLLNFIYSVDLWFVRYFLGKADSGYYNAAGTIFRTLGFIFLALSWVLLPSISRSVFQKDSQLTKQYIEQSTRFVLLFYVPFGLLIISTSENLISLLYSDLYLPAAVVLKILIVGSFFLTLFSVLNNILMADNKIKGLSVFTILLLIIDVLLNINLVPKLGLKGAAISTTITSIIGALIVSTVILKRFNARINYKSITRCLIASGLMYFVSTLYETSGFLLLLNYLFLFVFYVGLLVVLKEITQQDIEKLKRLYKRVDKRQEL